MFFKKKSIRINRGMIALGAAVLLALAAFFGYRHKNPMPSGPQNEVSVPPAPTPEETPGELKYRQVELPAITLQEFTAPNFVSAKPAHKEAVSLSELHQIQVQFSRILEKPSKIVVVSNNKVVAQGNSLSQDQKTLSVPVDAGTFNVHAYTTGIYAVYYDACFAGDTCYKGQYAFYGITNP